ncbi:P-loop NTPase fold protein [Metabacillus niabensis]|uniref:P-loop NTPase fold protein n=1 Tax=Metabacillus niabensis TaxID=324854 RepID=UPI0039A1713D
MGLKLFQKSSSDSNETEKIFLNDLPLNNEHDQNDKFQAIQIAEILKKSIIQSNFPLHISLLGKWGSGKTSIIKMLQGILDKDLYELKIISVWKFADDAPSLHRKIVREVERELNLENPESLDVSTTVEKQLQSRGALSNLHFLGKLGNYKWIVLISSIVFLMLVGLQFLLPVVFSGIINNAVMVTVVAIVTYLLGSNSYSILVSLKDAKVNIPLTHGDQYENRFKKVINKYLGEKNNKKLILVFDDLDRLPPKQLFGALNTIKTFLNSERCAFIIPCDEEILKSELQLAFEEKEMKKFKVTEYLNKTFDITIRLPKLEPSNMR